MTVKFFNGITKTLEPFIPGETIKIYCCGPTVYDDIHIGNGRPIIVFDSLACFLKNYYKKPIEYVRNITDIDEKIINKVKETMGSYEGFINGQIENFFNIIKYLEQFQPKNVRVTPCINLILDAITTLLDKGWAYGTKNGNIYFNTKKCPIYQCLSGPRQNEESISVANEEDKIHWEDFALWKSINIVHDKVLAPGEFYEGMDICWGSPWGNGIPGWHIECTTIIKNFLGDAIDIHGGGQDLIFPHHDNEIAQCWGLTEEIFCKYWLHNGMVLVNGKKMSKSTGNFIKLKDVVVDYESGYILKYLMLSTHHRQPLNFSPQKWNDAANNVKKIKNFFIQYKHYYDPSAYGKFLEKDNRDLLELVANDFNTVQGLMEVHRWIKQFKTLDSLSIQDASTCFFNVLFILESLGLAVKI